MTVARQLDDQTHEETTDLKGRGLQAPRLIISDACVGLVEAAAEHYPSARWQRCVVHFYRNAFTKVPRSEMDEVARMLKAIHSQRSRASWLRRIRGDHYSRFRWGWRKL